MKSTTRKKPVNYVDNKKFHQAIVEYRAMVLEAEKNNIEKPRIPNYVGECIWKIAENLAHKPCFINYSFREEMVSDGIENCILYFDDFDPNYNSTDTNARSPNPFSYFTQVIYYAFLRRIYKEEKNRYTTYKHFQETIGLQVYGELQIEDDHRMMTVPYDNINDFMGRFERREEEKKNKRRANKEGLSKFYEDQ